MELGLSGRVALVTGGSSGIGRACALALAAEGAHVCIVARDEARLAEALTAVEAAAAAGARCATVSADLSTEDGCRAAVEACTTQLGAVDVLVNSAGAASAAPVLELSTELLDDAFELKLYGYLRMAQLVTPAMRERGWGRIVNIAGGAGASPEDANLPTSLANIGVLNMTRALSDVLSGDGILVNTICPGTTDTERTRRRAAREGRSYPELVEAAGQRLPAGRIAQPEEIARVAVFLASEACSYVHGSSIYMDGGGRRGTP